jgi:hypothetical protein
MISMKGAEKEHCKISIGKLALRNLLFCHSGLDKPASYSIRGNPVFGFMDTCPRRNDTIKNERIQIEMLTLQFAMVLERK